MTLLPPLKADNEALGNAIAKLLKAVAEKGRDDV
jgi:hypothetical protein